MATVDDVSLVEFTQQVAFMTKFTDFNVRVRPISKEEVLILGVCLDPRLEIVRLQKFEVTLILEVL